MKQIFGWEEERIRDNHIREGEKTDSLTRFPDGHPRRGHVRMSNTSTLCFSCPLKCGGSVLGSLNLQWPTFSWSALQPVTAAACQEERYAESWCCRHIQLSLWFDRINPRAKCGLDGGPLSLI